MAGIASGHKEKDGIIIERTTDPESDMVKIKMEGNNIVQMSKDVPPEETAAEAIGPVKFSQKGGKAFNCTGTSCMNEL